MGVPDSTCGSTDSIHGSTPHGTWEHVEVRGNTFQEWNHFVGLALIESSLKDEGSSERSYIPEPGEHFPYVLTDTLNYIEQTLVLRRQNLFNET